MKALSKSSSIKRVVCVVKKGGILEDFGGDSLGDFLLGELFGTFEDFPGELLVTFFGVIFGKFRGPSWRIFSLDLLEEKLFGKSFWNFFERIFGKDFM